MSHLTDLELAEAPRERSAATTAHLASCEACRRDAEALARDVETLRVAHTRRMPSEPFFMRERAAVRRRLGTRLERFRPSLALGALATAALIVALVAPPRQRANPVAASPPAVSAEPTRPPDDALLLEAESLVAGSPAPLTSPL